MTRKILLLGSHALTAFCISFGLTASLATGLALTVSLPLLGVLCAASSVLLSLFFSRRHGPWCLVGLSVFFCFSAFWRQLRDIGRLICRNLHLGYGLPIPKFFLHEPPETHLLALLFLCLLSCCVTLWVLARHGSCSWVAIVSLVLLFPCVLVVDTVPASVPLGIWLAGSVLLALTQEVRRRDEAQALRLFGILLVPVALAVFTLFWLLPRGTAPNFDSWNNWYLSDFPWRQEESVGVLEGQPQVDLSDLKKPSQGDNTVMTVSGNYTGKLYLRGRDYDHYSRTGWTATKGRFETLPPNSAPQTTTLHVKTYLPLDQYFIPYTANGSLQFTSGLALEDGHMKNILRYEEYQFGYSHRTAFTVLQTEGDRSYFTQLPDATRQALDNMNLSFTAANPVLTANEIEKYVSNLAPYDINAKGMPQREEDFAVWFLQDGKSGFCVHYATAATVLLRYCGIPARYVEGYSAYVTEGLSPVAERSAHAWVEYYVAGHGWVVLDPTPGGPAAEVPPVTLPTAPPTTAPTEPVTTAPALPETSNAPTTESSPSPSTEPSSESCTDPGICLPPGEKEPPEWMLSLILWILGVLLAVAVFFGQWALRRYHIQKAMTTGKPNAQALARYRECLRCLKFLKQPELPELTALAKKAKFSQHTLSPEELQCLNKHLSVAKADLQELSVAARFVAKWLLALY